MNSLVDRLRSSRKNPAVLKLKILKIRGEAPDVLIFVYEGADDIPVYEEWMRRIAACPRYEPVAGAGKQQLLELHDSLIASNDDLIRHLFFFVDRDFDLPSNPSPHIHELSVYSLENLICTEDVIDSLLRDEFRLAGSVAERQVYIDNYRMAYRDFLAICEPIDFIFFISQRLPVPLIRRPEKIADIAHVELGSAQSTWGHQSDIIDFERECSLLGDELARDFSALPAELRHRGKFSLMFFRKWLREAANEMTRLRGEEKGKFISGDPSSSPLRRFASAVRTPESLTQFVTAL